MGGARSRAIEKGQRNGGCAVLGFLDLFVIASVAPGVRCPYSLDKSKSEGGRLVAEFWPGTLVSIFLKVSSLG